MQFYYDAQVRKYLLQFVRIFGSFTVQKGYDSNQNPIFESVPARYGDMSRHVAHILKDNSENTLNTVPFLSCYVSNLQMNPDLRRYPQFEETRQVIEKRFDEETHQYVEEPGQSYSVTRYQPVPYLLTMNVDIWTSNTDQKLQLLEQILVLFNPSVNLHTNENTLDWTSLTYCELVDTTWSSRSLPSGTDDVIDVATLQFVMPIYINPPVKVQRMNIIQTILTNLHTLDLQDLDDWTINNNVNSDYVIATLEDYWIRYENGSALLLDKTGADFGGVGAELQWKDDVFSQYGELRAGISQMRLRQGTDVSDPSNDVIGTIDFDPGNPQRLIVTIDTDTLPANTQDTVDRIINPQSRGPGDGILPVAVTGQRYLILDELPTGGLWGNSTADANDIIEYNGSEWIVSFDASANGNGQYTTDSNTTDQFEWTGSFWQNSYEGIYRKGWWRLYI